MSYVHPLEMFSIKNPLRCSASKALMLPEQLIITVAKLVWQSEQFHVVGGLAGQSGMASLRSLS